MTLRVEVTLKRGFGRKRCPICRAWPYTQCRTRSYGRRVTYRDTRHYERYQLEHEEARTKA